MWGWTNQVNPKFKSLHAPLPAGLPPFKYRFSCRLYSGGKMKAFLSIIASIYWIFFFTHPKGFYVEHIFELIVAILLTGFVLLIEVQEGK